MICLIKQAGAEIVSWSIGTTVESVAQQCDDELLTKEMLELARSTAHGIYRLQGGRYTLLVGTGGIRDRRLVVAG